jgi:Di- and tricarboxylate transporters
LLIIFFVSALLSCIIHNAAVIMMMYQALRLITFDALTPAKPLLALMAGASCSFILPTGYQTNLMVQHRGGYVFADYMRLGSILTVMTGLVTCTIIYILPESMMPLQIGLANNVTRER